MFTCSNCGKLIPEAGKVCPHCGIDKSADLAALAEKRKKLETEGKRSMAIIAAIVIGGAIGSTIGWGIDQSLAHHGHALGWIGIVFGAALGIAALYYLRPDVFKKD